MGKKKTYKKSSGRGIVGENVFIFITLALAIFSGISVEGAWNDILFLPGSVLASGTITACDMEYTKGGSYCNATISFETQSSQHTTFSEPAGDLKPGTAVIVRYHLNEPEEARMDTLSANLKSSGISLGLLLLDLCIFWYWRRRRAREYKRIHKGLAPNTVLKRNKQNKQIKRYDGYTRG